MASDSQFDGLLTAGANVVEAWECFCQNGLRRQELMNFLRVVDDRIDELRTTLRHVALIRDRRNTEEGG